MKDFLKLYSGLVERCFGDCVNDFTSKSLTSKEVLYCFLSIPSFPPSVHVLSFHTRSIQIGGKRETLLNATDRINMSIVCLYDLQEACIQKCADKFLKLSERVGQRFGEASAEMMGGAK
jgi:import inner membrane translocase subunit TIM9